MKRRHYWMQRQLLASLAIIELLIKSWSPGDDITAQQWQALKPDIDRLKRDSNLWDGRAAALQGIIVSIMSLEETRGQLRQHESVAALTALAFVFVPMTFVATVLGIQNTGPKSSYLLFAEAALPVAVATAFLWLTLRTRVVKRVVGFIGTTVKAYTPRWNT
jgi:Mg2+ and Co2+ transporter CorA